MCIRDSPNLEEICFYEESQLLKHLSKIHGVVIYSSAEENLNNILELILSINKESTIPVWVRSATESAIIGKRVNLELGVLGNLGRDISDEEMFAIIENTFNMIYGQPTKVLEPSSYADIQLNALNCSIKVHDKAEIRLTRLEYRIVSLLFTKVNQAFTYEEIYQHVWGDDEESSDKKYRVANLVFHIRNKLVKYGLNADLLRTVRSVGYLLDTKVYETGLKEVMELTS
uniref:OmpR/PhoB-type domain-containing protein n=1 Tax=Candidatus Enterococcus clewellii TaxID=1834193 RepID=A0A242K949_9ENTE|nr:winged helix-turn-helix domain-containing protein [Enterococcus sp. 9E7_DIV0242]OTP17599.1 hypothetical protein A5888_001737 [Enterococcus sp. 9E7_DIV0242]